MQKLELSVDGDARQALALSQWIRRGAPGCVVEPVHGPETDGAKGLDATTTLIITLLGTPAVAQLIDVLKAYVSARPNVTVSLTQPDGTKLGIVATGVPMEQIRVMASDLTRRDAAR